MINSTILVINQYYRPDVASSGQLLAELCEFLSSSSITIHVITGQPSYTSDAPSVLPEEISNGVIIHRVSLGNSIGKNTLITRFSGYLKFLLRSCILATKIARKTNPDVVMTLSNPPLVGLIGGFVAKRRKIPFVYVLYDIHPDILIATRWMNIPQIILKLWHLVNYVIFRSAATIIVPSETMKATLVNSKSLNGDKIHVIPNWARPEIKPQLYPTSIKQNIGIPPQEIMLLYAGNIGIMQQLDPILDAACKLRKTPLHFVFIGEGEKKEELVERVRLEGLVNVHFLPYQPEEQFAQIVLESDACFVTLLPGLDSYSAPSRAYTFLSAGTAIITIMPNDAELAKLITAEQCGWNVTTSDQLAQLLENLSHNRDEYILKGNNAQSLYSDHYKEHIIMERYLKILTEQI